MRTSNFKYETLAKEIEDKINTGVYKVGDKLPSIRLFTKKMNLSMVTVNRAFEELEKHNLIESKPKSGYYVKSPKVIPFELPKHRRFKSIPAPIALDKATNSIIDMVANSDYLPLGAGIIDPQLFPYKYFNRILKSFSADDIKRLLTYESFQGNYELRRLIAQHMMGRVEGIGPDDIIITNGCVEAASICLHALAKSGDIIAVESPTYYLLLQLLQELGIIVVEIPTTPQHGFDVDAYENVLKVMDIKACLLTPNFNNPMGSLMPDDKKEKLVSLAHKYNVPIIEDDIFSELHYQSAQPLPLKSHDQHDLVLTCSSFSKTLSPGFRIGWTIPGKRFKEKVLNLRGGMSVSSAKLTQKILTDFLTYGGYDRHLRNLRKTIQHQTYVTALAIKQDFPQGTKLAMPKGGYMLWVELPEKINSMVFFNKALEKNIMIVPGVICSNSRRFQNYIRMSCGFPFDQKMKEGVKELGNIAKELNF
ncbi:MAG: PLP-dependent aminotransferase family protein [SAR324 cluster bacterium]|nr:PLP-dependent aminotransferase family protein [SAR324 cluster bacterium]